MRAETRLLMTSSQGSLACLRLAAYGVGPRTRVENEGAGYRNSGVDQHRLGFVRDGRTHHHITYAQNNPVAAPAPKRFTRFNFQYPRAEDPNALPSTGSGEARRQARFNCLKQRRLDRGLGLGRLWG